MSCVSLDDPAWEGDLTSCEGPLWKYSTGRKRLTRKTWKRRWCVANDQGFEYYKNSESQRPQYRVEWNKVAAFCTLVTAAMHPLAVDPDSFYFLLSFRHKGSTFPLLMYTNVLATRRRWVQTLCHWIQPSVISIDTSFLDLEEDELDENQLAVEEIEELLRQDELRARGNDELMANHVITSSTLRNLVSKSKCRYQADGFDLDLAYITPQIVAMGYPSEGVEAVYRNPYQDVLAFFEHYHHGAYRVYNLCSERYYEEEAHFYGAVEYWPFDDHNPPPLSLLPDFCVQVRAFLGESKDRVAGIHCKAGKGRTGTMICALLMWMGLCGTADEALEFYASARTKNGKGVTIPSQIRYVHYCERLLRDYSGGVPPEGGVTIKCITLHTTPHFDRSSGCMPYFTITQRDDEGSLYIVYDSRDAMDPLPYVDAEYIGLLLEEGPTIEGDAKFSFYNFNRMTKDDFMFFLWVHTGLFPTDGKFLTIPKLELDKAKKDKSCERFDAEFAVTIEFE